jgi:hypothetical protein
MEKTQGEQESRGKMKRAYELVMNFFYFWRSDYYGDPICARLAWELANIHVEHDIKWDAMIIVKASK